MISGASRLAPRSRTISTSPMARYEVAVATPVTFFATEIGQPPTAAQMVIDFDGHHFVWHRSWDGSNEQCWPVVTLMVENADDAGGPSEVCALDQAFGGATTDARAHAASGPSNRSNIDCRNHCSYWSGPQARPSVICR